MKSDVLVIVANSTIARIFRAETIHHLVEVETLIHPGSRQHARDLVSDRPGRAFESSHTGTRHALEPKTDPQQVEFEEFAKNLSKYLDHACQNGSCKKIYLAANPQFLGLLRPHLTAKASQLIVNQLDKDITQIPTVEIPKYFDLIL